MFAFNTATLSIWSACGRRSPVLPGDAWDIPPQVLRCDVDLAPLDGALERGPEVLDAGGGRVARDVLLALLVDLLLVDLLLGQAVASHDQQQTDGEEPRD